MPIPLRPILPKLGLPLLAVAPLALTAACASAPEDPAERGAAAYERGAYEVAVAEYSRAIEERPGEGHLYDLRGEALYELGRHEEALADLDHAIALDPADAYAHSHRGQVLVQLGRPAEAVESFDRAIALAPDVEHFRRFREKAASRL
jgi:tetratricopeptide (TPR) repeat protein